jgi:hypothetical protein
VSMEKRLSFQYCCKRMPMEMPRMRINEHHFI